MSYQKRLMFLFFAATFPLACSEGAFRAGEASSSSSPDDPGEGADDPGEKPPAKKDPDKVKTPDDPTEVDEDEPVNIPVEVAGAFLASPERFELTEGNEGVEVVLPAASVQHSDNDAVEGQAVCLTAVLAATFFASPPGTTAAARVSKITRARADGSAAETLVGADLADDVVVVSIDPTCATVAVGNDDPRLSVVSVGGQPFAAVKESHEFGPPTTHTSRGVDPLPNDRVDAVLSRVSTECVAEQLGLATDAAFSPGAVTTVQPGPSGVDVCFLAGISASLVGNPTSACGLSPVVAGSWNFAGRSVASMSCSSRCLRLPQEMACDGPPTTWTYTVPLGSNARAAAVDPEGDFCGLLYVGYGNSERLSCFTQHGTEGWFVGSRGGDSSCVNHCWTVGRGSLRPPFQQAPVAVFETTDPGPIAGTWDVCVLGQVDIDGQGSCEIASLGDGRWSVESSGAGVSLCGAVCLNVAD